jgi:class 3 adenylate cyclase
VDCASCGTSNDPNASFCGSCGQALGLTCNRCRFPIPANARFCGGCGSRVEHVQANDLRGERRLLTVMFCDLAGSVELSRLLDPEDLARVLALYQRIVGDAVQEFDGEVSNYVGDGIVMHFGYPRAHEDDAQRAVRCGLEILRRIEEARQASTLVGADRLQARLGLHTGQVLVNPIGVGERITSIALGDVPNMAARIQSEAETGTLVVSESTWRLVRGYVLGTEIGERALKGVAEPIRLWRVDRANTSQERVEVAATLTPLVGRDAELAELRTAWEAVAERGQARFVLLTGDPGLGKSRLARAACVHAEERGGSSVLLRSTPYNSASPYLPVIEHLNAQLAATGAEGDHERRPALGRLLDAAGIAGDEALALVAPLLSLPMDDLPPFAMSPARQRSRTMDLLAQLLTAGAASAPLLLVFEDLHWADASTLELVELLVSAEPDLPVLVLLTARPELELAWSTHPGIRTIELARLDEASADAMIRHVAGNKALPSELSRLLLQRSDGVPLFVEEMTRALMDSDVLVERSASWEVSGPLPDDTIPASVHASLTARIDRLGPSRPTAQLAATIGREFSLELLIAVSGRAATTVQTDLDRLVEAGLAFAEDERGETFVFKHALVRDAAYNSLLRSTRLQYHRQIADTMRDEFPSIAFDRPDLVADHLTRAGAAAEAVRFWQAAAQQAMGRAAFGRPPTSSSGPSPACKSCRPRRSTRASSSSSSRPWGPCS